MSTTVFLAVIGAAALHAVWNALVKGSADKTLAMAAVVMGHVPPALVALTLVPPPDPASWPWLAGGIALHVGYQLFLLRAYAIGDLTQVYPIARGSAPLIVALVSVTVMGVALSKLELAAVGLIACGIMSLALVRRGDGLRNPRAAAVALGTGCFIAGYSLVDGTGARLAGTSVGFYSWLTLCNSAVMAVILRLAWPGTLSRLPREGLRMFLIGGLGSYAAYAIVTWAFTQAPITLVTALRETSIVFALLIGVLVLKERLDLAKVISTTLTLAGAALLRAAR